MNIFTTADWKQYLYLITLVGLLVIPVAAEEVWEPEPIDLRFTDLPLCLPHHIIQHYTLDDPPSCANLDHKNTVAFTADVFAPPPAQKLVKAIACSVRREGASFTSWFFGAQTTQDRFLNYVAPSVPECVQWDRQRISELGRLSRTSRKTVSFATNNKLVPTFSWPGTVSKVVENAIMEETSLSFNVISGAVHHALDVIDECSLSSGYCRSEKAMYLFKPFNLECVDSFRPVKMNTTVLVHGSDPSDRFFQIPDIDLAFTTLTSCPESTSRCYAEYEAVRCTSTHFVVATKQHDAVLLNSSSLSDKFEPIETDSPNNLVYAQSLTSLALSLDDEIQSLRSQQVRLACSNTRIQLTNLKSSQFINPSEVLSVILNRPAFASIGTSTLQEMACVNTTGVLKPTLWVGSRLAGRPILLIDHDNETREAQFTRGGYAQLGLHDFMPRHEGHSIFEIQNRMFVFQNGTLLQENIPEVHTLDINRKISPLRRTRPNTETLVKRFNFFSSPVALDYIQQTLEALHLINAAQLAAHGFAQEDINHHTTKRVSTVERLSFFHSIVDRLQNKPPLYFTIFRWGAVFWVSIATLLTVYVLLATIIRYTRKKCEKPADSSDTPSEDGIVSTPKANFAKKRKLEV